MKKFKTYSEKYFALYLRHCHLRWSYEQNWGGKYPDFTILNKFRKKLIAITDVKEFKYSKAEERTFKKTGMITGTSNPYKRIRGVINSARKQFKHCKNHPCILILYGKSGPPLVSKLIVLASMLGDLTISIPIKKDGKLIRGKSQTYLGRGGKMHDDKHNQPQNKTITAIGILGSVSPEIVASGYDQELKKRSTHIDVNKKGWLEEFTKIDKALKIELKAKGYRNLGKYVPCVEYIINPYASKPFPLKAFAKGYTYVNEYDLSTGKLSVIYDWSKKKTS